MARGGNRAMTKEELIAQSRKERMEREVVRKKYDAATNIQKSIRSYLSNKHLTN